MRDQHSPVAVFDFDGTVTTGESFLPFMRYVVGPVRFWSGMGLLLPWLAAYALGQISNRAIKEKVIGYFLKGRSVNEVSELGKVYAQQILPYRVRDDAREQFSWHLEKGHWLVLASASLSVYLEPWGKNNGFHGICGADLEVDDKGKITGRILGNNCFGPEKLEAVHHWIGERNPQKTYAYGDSHGDRELLDWADVKFFKGVPMTESGQKVI